MGDWLLNEKLIHFKSFHETKMLIGNCFGKTKKNPKWEKYIRSGLYLHGDSCKTRLGCISSKQTKQI